MIDFECFCIPHAHCWVLINKNRENKIKNKNKNAVEYQRVAFNQSLSSITSG